MTTPIPPGPHASASDEEVIFYEGSPLLRGELPLLFRWLLVSMVLIAIPVIWKLVATVNTPPWYVWLGCILGAVLVLIIPAIWVRRTKFRITNYRIDYESGLISKNIDTLELWHVEDVKLHQGIVDRMLGVGTIMIFSADATTPTLALRSIAQPRKVFESVKQRLIAVKRQRGVLKVDGGFEHDHTHPSA